MFRLLHLLFLIYRLVASILYFWGPLPFSVMNNNHFCICRLIWCFSKFVVFSIFLYLWCALSLFVFKTCFLLLLLERFAVFAIFAFFVIFVKFVGTPSLVPVKHLLFLCLSLAWFHVFLRFVIFVIFVGPFTCPPFRTVTLLLSLARFWLNLLNTLFFCYICGPPLTFLIKITERCHKQLRHRKAEWNSDVCPSIYG